MRTLRTSTIRPLCVALVLIALTIAAGAQSRDRSQTPDKYKWNLAEIYPTDAAWRAAKDKLAADLPKLRQFQGKLATSAATLADALDLQARLHQGTGAPLRLRRACSPIRTRATAAHEGMRQEMNQLAAAVRRRVVVHRTGAAEDRPGNGHDVRRLRAAAEGLQLLPRRRLPPRAAHAERRRGEAARRRRPARRQSPSSVFNILSNADFPYPTVTLSDGKSVKLDQAAFGELRALPNRADRQKVMSAFFSALGSFSRTFGTSMNGEVQKVAVLREGAEVSVRRSRRSSTARTSRRRSTRGWSTA